MIYYRKNIQNTYMQIYGSIAFLKKKKSKKVEQTLTRRIQLEERGKRQEKFIKETKNEIPEFW